MIHSYEAYVAWIEDQEHEQERLEQCRATEEAAAILKGERPISEVHPDTHDTDIQDMVFLNDEDVTFLGF